MIEVSNISKLYDDFIALNHLNMRVETGAIYGLVGNNGAGKTTLLKILSGIYKQELGKVEFQGEEIFDNEKIKEKIFFVPDSVYFTLGGTMRSMAKFYRGFYPKFNMELFYKLCEIFKLNPKKRLLSFSKGMQRQAILILALSSCAEYLILDESFDGIDPVKRDLLKKILLEAMAEKEITIIISSHNLRELEDLCDHIGFIKNKKIIFQGSVDEIRNSRCRCRVIFKDEMKEEDFKGSDYKNLNVQGKVVTFVTEKSQEDIEKDLQNLEMVLVEYKSLTFEEIFLDEMEVEKNDFKDLFKEI